MKKQKYIIIFIIMSLALAICGTLFIRNYIKENSTEFMDIKLQNKQIEQKTS